MGNFLECLAGGVMGVFGFTMLILISLADRIGKRVPPSAGLRPEESERPALIPHKLDPDIDALCKEIEEGEA